MTPPSRIVVGGFPYTVEVLPRDLIVDGGMAEHNLRLLAIRISTEQHPAQERDSLLHEVVHAILRTFDLADHKADERFVNVFTTALIDTLRRNPELVPFLMEPEPDPLEGRTDE